MNKKITTLALQIFAAIIIVSALIYYFIYKKPATNETGVYNPPVSDTSATTTPPVVGENKPSSVVLPKTSAVAKPATITQVASSSLKMLLPASGDSWSINKNHLIAWSKPAGYVGSIELVKASNGEIVGWLLANTGENQDYFLWDARDFFLSRQAGMKKNLEPGDYKIRIVFDKKFSPIESAQFSVAKEGSAESNTSLIRIKDKKITPSNLSVSNGAKIIFMNNDLVKHQMSGSGAPSFSMNAGDSYSLDTSSLNAGTYYYYSSIYSYLAPFTLTIK